MHLSDEGIVTQLGYPANESNLAQLQKVMHNTPGFETIKRHILALADHIKPYGGYVAFSSSKPYLKIKIERSSTNPTFVVEEIHKWAKKYNILLDEVKKEETYYILGVAS